MLTQDSDPHFYTCIEEAFDSRVSRYAEFHRDATVAYVGPHLYLAPVDRYQADAAYLVFLTHVLNAQEM
jgi:hypothetical protein